MFDEISDDMFPDGQKVRLENGKIVNLDQIEIMAYGLAVHVGLTQIHEGEAASERLAKSKSSLKTASDLLEKHGRSPVSPFGRDELKRRGVPT